ncbi:MAG: sodium-dependent transporter [Clostridia bacterium]|nr:sodium-dependent transporter [Clostridia bacterium]
MDNNSQKGRARLGSRLGFILLSAGCAIGVGNVWKFPWMVGQYGGGIFVLLYLVFLVIMGLPVMTMEFSLGRASRKSPICLYDELPGHKAFRVHGWVSFIGMYVLMMFYTVVTGWMLYYFFNTATGSFEAMGGAVTSSFSEMLADPVSMTVCTVIVVLAGFLVNSFGVEKGLERVTKVMMIALLVLMVVLAVYCCTLRGAGEGLLFYLVPDINKMLDAGIINVISGAMLQALFTLSLGIGTMAIFGSYIGKERALLGESANVAALDTFVALVSGFIIFPACFTYAGGVTTAGPGLIFSVLPAIFNDMPFGRLCGSLFFVFMSFAAFSTILAVFEGILACTMDKFGWSRKKACIVNGVLILLLSIPCVLGFNVWSGFAPLGKNIQDWEDFFVSYLLLPLGSLAYIIYCTNKRIGWGFDNLMNEANQGEGLKVKRWMYGYMKYVLPVIMVIVFVFGLLSFFGVTF